MKPHRSQYKGCRVSSMHFKLNPHPWRGFSALQCFQNWRTLEYYGIQVRHHVIHTSLPKRDAYYCQPVASTIRHICFFERLYNLQGKKMCFDCFEWIPTWMIHCFCGGNSQSIYRQGMQQKYGTPAANRLASTHGEIWNNVYVPFPCALYVREAERTPQRDLSPSSGSWLLFYLNQPTGSFKLAPGLP